MRQYPSESERLLSRLFDPTMTAWLAMIEAAPGEVFMITSHEEDVVFEEILWQSVPMKLERLEDNGKGDLPSTTLTITNVGGLAMPYLERGEWRQGLVLVLLVFIDRPDLPPLMELAFRLQGAAVTHEKVSLVIGQSDIHDQQFPRERFLRARYPGIPQNAN